MSSNSFVIGHPIHHSKSPLIHNFWLKTLGMDGQYEAIDVTPAELPQFFEQLHKGSFKGGNVTVPHKEQALKLCDTLSTEAVEIGAANTLIIKDDGVHGTNTDMYGFLANLDQKAPGWDTNNDAALVLGAGGAARAVLIGLRNRGFKTIHIINRTLERAETLANDLSGPYIAHPMAEFANLAKTASLVANTTTIGMHGTRFENLDLSGLKPDMIVTDIVYTPLQTPLLADADACGLKTVDGLGMLLHQAVPAFEAWYGQRPEVTPQLRDLVEKALEQA